MILKYWPQLPKIKNKNPLNNLDYASSASWIDRQRGLGYTDEQINGYLSRQNLDSKAWHKFNGAMSSNATNIRRAEEESWEAQGELAEFIAYGIIPMGPVGGLLGKVGGKIINLVGKTGGKILRHAATGSTKIASSAGGLTRPMQFERYIAQGSKLDDIINDIKGMTFTTGNEHAVVRLANGQKAIVSGGPGGIRFESGQIRTLFGHTHPTSAPPSSFDFKALRKLEQSKQYVLHGGETTIVRP